MPGWGFFFADAQDESESVHFAHARRHFSLSSAYIMVESVIRTTVDSRYLEVQGTLWNTSRYPYLDLSDLQN